MDMQIFLNMGDWPSKSRFIVDVVYMFFQLASHVDVPKGTL